MFDFILFPPRLPDTLPSLGTRLGLLLAIGLAGFVLGTGALIARNRRLLDFLPHRCLGCGTLNPPDARFCSNCGAALSPGPAADPSGVPPPAG